MKPQTTFFSPDYATANSSFRAAAARVGATLQTLPLDAKGPAGESLGIEIAWLGSDDPRRVLIHSSGLHGVEGFAGSAIQLQFLTGVPVIPQDAAIVLVHILNPYGMAWLRRVNENNVDLNRNFTGDSLNRTSPPLYSRLDTFLNPKSAPSKDGYYIKVARLLLSYGLTALKQTVAGGQFEHPRGLFYGGSKREQGTRLYMSFLSQRFSGVAKMIAIDVHTGLGKFSEDTLLVEEKGYARLSALFGARVKALEPKVGPAYKVEGGMDSMLLREFSKAEPCFIGQEFGTYSGIKVLHALREENRWHHYGEGTLRHPSKTRLKEAFCPDNEHWEKAVLKRGGELLGQACDLLARL